MEASEFSCRAGLPLRGLFVAGKCLLAAEYVLEYGIMQRQNVVFVFFLFLLLFKRFILFLSHGVAKILRDLL